MHEARGTVPRGPVGLVLARETPPILLSSVLSGCPAPLPCSSPGQDWQGDYTLHLVPTFLFSHHVPALRSMALRPLPRLPRAFRGRIPPPRRL